MDAARTYYTALESAVGIEDYETATKICHRALAAGGAQHFWKTQLGYVCFLNEKDAEAYYNQAPSIFGWLVVTFPADENAWFWLGYLNDIVLDNQEHARTQLREALKLDTNHPYANLVLAGIVDPLESIKLLRRTLTRQPANFRALHQLADILSSINKEEQAEILMLMLQEEVYVEKDYGIMNSYMNDVFIGVMRVDAWRAAARAQLGR